MQELDRAGKEKLQDEQSAPAKGVASLAAIAVGQALERADDDSEAVYDSANEGVMA